MCIILRFAFKTILRARCYIKIHSTHAVCAHVRTFVPVFKIYTNYYNIDDANAQKRQAKQKHAVRQQHFLIFLVKNCANRSFCCCYIITVCIANMTDGFVAYAKRQIFHHKNANVHLIDALVAMTNACCSGHCSSI